MGKNIKTSENSGGSLTKILLPLGVLAFSGTIVYLIFRKKDSKTNTNTNTNSGGIYISDIGYLAPENENGKIKNENVTEVRLKNENNSLQVGVIIRIEGTDYDGIYTIIDRWVDRDRNLVRTVKINLRSGLPITGKTYNNAKVYLVAKGSGSSGKNSGGGSNQNIWSTLGNLIKLGAEIITALGGGSNQEGGSDLGGGGNFDGDDLSKKFNH